MSNFVPQIVGILCSWYTDHQTLLFFFKKKAKLLLISFLYIYFQLWTFPHASWSGSKFTTKVTSSFKTSFDLPEAKFWTHLQGQ